MNAIADPLLRYADQNLPRYTSYPTAPHFGPLEETTYREWLHQVTPEESLSLYLHVPFCRSLCWYCGCHTAVTRSTARLARYAEGLKQEASLLAAALPRGAHAGVAALHLGGGTPSQLGASLLAEVLAALNAAFGFRPDAELAIEIDPRLLDDDLLRLMTRFRFRRASLGVQDISPEVQALIGREQPAEMVADAVRRLRGAGVAGINMDLIYGLPGQTEAHVAASARFAAEQGADRVAVFGYAHVPWMKPHQNAIDAALLPGAPARLDQAAAAERVLLEAGYVAIGLDHFARPGDAMAVAADERRLKRNFQGYSVDPAPVLLGLGASSIGTLRSGHVQNEADERLWLAALQAQRLPVRRGRALTPDDRLRGRLIEQLMCEMEIDLRSVPDDVWSGAWPRLMPLVVDGLATLDGGWLRVTAAGRRFLRHVAASFDAFLASGPGRHSRAV